MLGPVLSVVASLLLFLIAAGGVMLLAPMRIEARAVFPEEKFLRTRIRFLWGSTPWVRLPAVSLPRRDGSESRTRRASKKKKAGGRMKSLFSAGPKIIRSLLAAIKFECGEVKLEYGSGDPADTGMLFGYMAPIIYANPAADKFKFSAIPHYDDEVFRFEGVAQILFRPAYLLPAIALIAWKLIRP